MSHRPKITHDFSYSTHFTPPGVLTRTQSLQPCNTIGNDVAFWRDKIAKLQSAQSAYETDWIEGLSPANLVASCNRRVRINSTYPPMYRHTYYSGILTRYGWSGYPWPSDYSDDRQRAQVIERLRNKLAQSSAEFNSLVPLAEAKELRGLVKQTAALGINVVKTLIDIKHGKLKDAYSRASDIWLGFSFGVKPLIGDTIAISESLANFFNRSGQSMRVSTKSSGSRFVRSAKGSPFPVIHNGYLYARAIGRFECELSYSGSAGIKLDISSANDYGSLSKQLGFAPANLIPTAWELVPFSWVVDYFTTAGEFLEDTFLSPSGNTYFCSISSRFKYKFTGEFELIEPSSSDTVDPFFNAGSASYRGGHFAREVLSAIPHKQFRLRSLDEIGLHSVNKLLNLAAVLGK